MLGSNICGAQPLLGSLQGLLFERAGVTVSDLTVVAVGFGEPGPSGENLMSFLAATRGRKSDDKQPMMVLAPRRLG